VGDVQCVTLNSTFALTQVWVGARQTNHRFDFFLAKPGFRVNFRMFAAPQKAGEATLARRSPPPPPFFARLGSLAAVQVVRIITAADHRSKPI
jgi:hypothetical protein